MAQLDYKLLGRRVRTARQNKNMTQDTLAEACGLSTAHIGHIERGTRIPSVDTLFCIATVLQVSTDSLLMDSASDPQQALASVSAILAGKDREQVKKFLAAVKVLAEKIDEL